MSSYFTEGLARIGVELSVAKSTAEVEYLDEMLRWSKRINLTSIHNYEEALEKHLIDSLILLKHMGSANSLLDIGSGGGLPGIPLAVALPELQVVSVDSIGKKINFQKHIKRTLRLENLKIVQSRIEQLGEVVKGSGGFDLVVSRAFADLAMMVECSEPWLSANGRIIAMKGPEGINELRGAMSIIKQLGFKGQEVITYNLPYTNAVRQLIVLQK